MEPSIKKPFLSSIDGWQVIKEDDDLTKFTKGKISDKESSQQKKGSPEIKQERRSSIQKMKQQIERDRSPPKSNKFKSGKNVDEILEERKLKKEEEKKEAEVKNRNNHQSNQVFLDEATKNAQERIKENKLKCKKVLKINTSKCRGEVKLIKHIIGNYGWKEVQDVETSNILWCGLPLKPDDFYLPLLTKVNRIPGMDELSHKKTTGWFLNKSQEYWPDNYDFYPRTFLLPEQMKRFITYYEAHSKEKYLYIAKPTEGSQGDGIILVRKPEDLNKLSSLKDQEYIVQRYIDNPLLLNNKKKFDLRLYVLISSVKPLLVYLNDHGLARYCTEEYEKPTMKNLNNHYMHLTNYTLNKQSDKYIYTKECEEIIDASKTTLVSFWKSIEAAGFKKEQIMEPIEELIKNFITSMYPFMLNDLNTFYGTKEERSSQILGFDILIDDNLKPWLLEINSNPSLSIDFDPYSEKLKYPEISPVDFYVKEKVVEDSLLIMNKSKKKQQEIEAGNYFNTYKCLIDGSIQEIEEIVFFNKLLEIYGKLSGFKFRGYISSVKFNKLHPILSKITDKIQRYDYDLILQKMSGGAMFLDFYNFIRVIEHLAEKIYVDFDMENKLPSINKLVNYLSDNLIV